MRDRGQDDGTNSQKLRHVVFHTLSSVVRHRGESCDFAQDRPFDKLAVRPEHVRVNSVTACALKFNFAASDRVGGEVG